MKNMIGIIPCRYQSTRFPGKPLADIGDKPMMWHVYHQALEAKELDDVYIATDDFRIKDACDHFGLKVMMTRSDHLTGTDRLAECAQKINSPFFVNIQGDEPFISPESIDAVAACLRQSDNSVVVTNAYSKLESLEAAENPNVVKVTLSQDSNALCFSRSLIPNPLRGSPTYLRQLGLYAFRSEGLLAFSKRQQGPSEQCEGVEMLRFLEYGDCVKMVEVDDSGIAVDTPEDLRAAIEHFKALQ